MNQSKNVVSKKNIGLWDYIYSKINTLASLGHLRAVSGNHFTIMDIVH